MFGGVAWESEARVQSLQLATLSLATSILLGQSDFALFILLGGNTRTMNSVVKIVEILGFLFVGAILIAW